MVTENLLSICADSNFSPQNQLELNSSTDLVLDRVECEPSPRLQCTQPNIVNGGHRYHKAIPGERERERQIPTPLTYPRIWVDLGLRLPEVNTYALD